MQHSMSITTSETRETRIDRLHQAGVPLRHVEVLVRLANAADAVAFDPGAFTARVAAQWRGSEHLTLVLGGDTGTGKSLAACWLIDQGPRRHHEGCDPKLRPRFIYGHHLQGGAGPEVDLVEQYPLLVIDNFTSVVFGNTEDWLARLDTIIASRSDRGLDTILTTPLKAAEFGARHGERLLGRLSSGRSSWVDIRGASLRRSTVDDERYPELSRLRGVSPLDVAQVNTSQAEE